MKRDHLISQERLRSLFHYDPETGVFTRRVTRHWLAKEGDVAGCLNPKGYWMIHIDKTTHSAHRLAFLYMTGSIPEQVDHIDRNRANNAWNNLRAANPTVNAMNRGRDPRNKSGYAGVSWNRDVKKWQAKIRINGVAKRLGFFSDPKEASDAYEKAKLESGYHPTHGEALRLLGEL